MTASLFFALSPIPIGLTLMVFVPRCRGIQDLAKSLAPTFFLAVALHFALFANLLASELWNNVVKSNVAISREVSGLESMLRIAEASLGECSVEIQDSVRYYREEVISNEFSESLQPESREGPFPLKKLYRLLVTDPEFIPNPTMKSLFKDSLEQVRAARYERLELKSSHISQIKFVVLFIFGLLTLIAIVVYHSANRSALIFTTLLFSVCFSLTMGVMRVLDQPYLYPYLITSERFENLR